MTDAKLVTPFREKLEILLLTESEGALTRAKKVIAKYYLTFRHLSLHPLPMENSRELQSAQLILMVQENGESLLNFSKRMDEAFLFFPRSKFVTVMAPNLSHENVEGATNSRVTNLSQSEFYATLKFEYLCLYHCRSQYFEVQVGDFFPMTQMLLSSYVRLGLNQRYLAVTHSETLLSDERAARLAKMQGLYIRHQDTGAYVAYINTYYDSSGKGLRKRARALFLSVCYFSLFLNENILFDFKSSEEQVREIYGKLKESALSLFEIMRSEEDLWDTFREAWEDDFSLLWRAPWISTYAALISLKSGLGDPLVAFMSGMLMDLGLYDLKEDVTREYLLSEGKEVSEEHMSDFKKHPILSLNRVLIKKIHLDDAVKAVLICAHEQADEKGFPNQVPKDKLPVEAQLLLIAERIDKEALTSVKKSGVGFRFAKEKMWEKEKALATNFSVEFLDAISQAII